MFENYPEPDDDLQYIRRGKPQSAKIMTSLIRMANEIDVNDFGVEEGELNTVHYYNMLATALKGVNFTESTLPPQKATEENFYNRGLIMFNLINDRRDIQSINSIFMDMDYNKEAIEEFSEANDLVANLFDKIRNIIDGPDETVVSNDEIQSLQEALSIRDIKNLKGRTSVYEYWENYYNQYFDIKTLEYRFTIPEGQEGNELFATMENAFSDIKIPSIVLAHGDAKFSQTAGGLLPEIKIVNDILSQTMRMEIDEIREFFGEPTTMSSRRVYDDSGNESSSPVGEYNPGSGGTSEEIQNIEKEIDPLTFLHLSQKNMILLEDDVKEFDNIKEKTLGKLLPLFENFTPVLRDEIEELVSEAIEEYTTLIDKERDTFYLPMLDNHITEMNNITVKGAFELPYYEVSLKRIITNETVEEERKTNPKHDPLVTLSGVITSTHEMILSKEFKTVNSYSQITNFINSECEKLFDVLNKFTVVGEMRRFNRNIPVKETQGGKNSSTGSGQQGALGSIYPSIRGTLPSFTQVGDSLNTLTSLVEEMFIKKIDEKYFFEKDLPNFTKSNQYKTFKEALSRFKNSRGTSLTSQIANFYTTAIDVEDLKSILYLIISFRKGSTENMNTLVKNAENAIQPLIIINSKNKQTRQEKTQSRKEIVNTLGKLIYGYAVQQERGYLDKEFDGKRLDSYETESVNPEVLDILPILNNQIFNESLDSEERSIVRKIKENMTGSFYQEYIKDSINSDDMALMKAIDILRERGGLPVYKAYLDINNIEDVVYVADVIRKENRTDIYATDMETIIEEKNSTIAGLSTRLGISQEVIYKVRGLFR